MKRILPILGIFLITTLIGCSPKEVNKSSLTDQEMKELLNSYRNSHRYSEVVDDFDNSITWKKSLSSKFKYPTNDSNYRMYDVPERSATLFIRCTKYADNSRKYVLEFDPPISIDYGGARFLKVEMKWDDMQPENEYVTPESFPGGTFQNAEYLIKKLDKHEKLKIRYKSSKGTQIIEFSLNKLERIENKDLSELVAKCSGAEY